MLENNYNMKSHVKQFEEEIMATLASVQVLFLRYLPAIKSGCLIGCDHSEKDLMIPILIFLNVIHH